MSKHTPPATSPWGAIDFKERVTHGIWFVGTSSHGGYWLSDERIKALPAWAKSFTPFTGSLSWFEEDCDAAVVALAFPVAFPAGAHTKASAFVEACERNDSYFSTRGLDVEKAKGEG